MAGLVAPIRNVTTTMTIAPICTSCGPTHELAGPAASCPIGMATKLKNPSIAMIRDSMDSGTFSWTVRFHARLMRQKPHPLTRNATDSGSTLAAKASASIGAALARKPYWQANNGRLMVTRDSTKAKANSPRASADCANPQPSAPTVALAITGPSTVMAPLWTALKTSDRLATGSTHPRDRANDHPARKSASTLSPASGRALSGRRSRVRKMAATKKVAASTSSAQPGLLTATMIPATVGPRTRSALWA